MRPRVLIFEDGDIFDSTLLGHMSDRGYDVCSFSAGICPFKLPFDQDCPSNDACADIIISDTGMHARAKLILIKELLNKGCKIKNRALISNYWSDLEVQYAQEIGCQVFHKPLIIEDMFQWLDDCGKRIKSDRKLSDLAKKQDPISEQ